MLDIKKTNAISNEEQKQQHIEKLEMVSRSKMRKRYLSYIAAGLIVAAVTAGGIAYGINGSKAQEEVTTTYKVQAVDSGTIQTNVSGSGKLISGTTTTVTMAGAGTMLTVNKGVGDTVEAGETIATIKSSEVSEALSSLYSQLTTLNSTISSTSKTASSRYVVSGASGKVKSVQVESGSDVASVMAQKGYLCLISTDGKMKVILSDTDLKKNEEVTVTIGENTETGTVTKVLDGKAAVEIATNKYEVGAEAVVSREDGTELGSGSLELNSYVKVTGTEGNITSVIKGENATVYGGTSIFKLDTYPESDTYTALIKQREELEQQIRDLERQLSVSVDYSGIITALNASAGDSLSADQTVAVIGSTDGYTLSLTVDESDISTLKVGQKAQITLDALSGTFEGEVIDVSYEGTTDSAVTSYGVTVKTGKIEGAIPGMSASCVITTSTSENTLVVPVEAVKSERGESYVYLARAEDKAGDEIDGTTINTDNLTKVIVETGMSDGINIGITGNLKDGDLVLVPAVTSTNTGENSQSSDEKQGMQMGAPSGSEGMTPPSGGGGMQRGGQ